jgi:hypothetical protein
VSSLYGAACGQNSLYDLLLMVLASPFGGKEMSIPPCRDAWYDKDEQGRVCVVVLTRTGGANRGSYLQENALMRSHPWFSFDVDDTYDSTYAYFWFVAPPDLSEAGEAFLRKHGKPKTLKERFDAAIARVREGHVPDLSGLSVMTTDGTQTNFADFLKKASEG